MIQNKLNRLYIGNDENANKLKIKIESLISCNLKKCYFKTNLIEI